jgi:L-threonylcarbamoyladenylate synthase
MPVTMMPSWTYDQNLISRVVNVIGEGGIVAAPTDTVYGLLADATNEAAVRNVFKIKQRPESKPLPVLVHSTAMAAEFSKLTHEATMVAHHFWVDEKRPLTIVAHLLETCNNKISLAESVMAGGDTVAIRMPNSMFLIDVMTKLGRPLVAPSANVHGRPPATNYHAAVESFGSYVSDTFTIVDGGESECASASTIIDFSLGLYRIIREGPVSENEIVEFVESL